MDFPRFFEHLTGQVPYPYQVRLAERPAMPDTLSVPTGLGKTSAVVVSWLWRRTFSPEAIRSSTPRRLVYCLPTRVLVRQTVRCISGWLERYEAIAGPESGRIRVIQLMGGERSDSLSGDAWEMSPMSSCVIVGTQDMLLSRALNRGYAMSRFAWPIHFAFLNSDSLWILDETQLMGPGLTTSVQLDGLRRKLGVVGPAHTLWMSATVDPGRLETIDNPGTKDSFTLSASDLEDPDVCRKLNSVKSCSPAMIDDHPIELGSPTYFRDLAAFVKEVHRPGTLTLVVVNTVGRSQELYRRLAGHCAGVRLVHSAFRRMERDSLEEAVLRTPGESGSILVSTQVVEAGVDISAATLITEPAPWPGLVQRMGRCNRHGEFNDSGANVYWISPSGQDADSLPYPHHDVVEGIRLLSGLSDASPRELGAVRFTSAPDTSLVLRRKDLVELFDTTPDLLGFDMDVGRYIRELDEPDVHVFWRDLRDGRPDETTPDADPEELCRVSRGQFALFLKKQEHTAFIWNHITGRWSPASPSRLLPGAIYLLDAAAGGYQDSLGWTGNAGDHPTPSTGSHSPDHQSADLMTRAVQGPVALSRHSADVASEIDLMKELLPGEIRPVLHRAALLHDAGKAHPVFLEAAGASVDAPLAKSPAMRSYSRSGFRHELASALMALQSGESDLLCYLVAAHHGKIRMSLRSQPDETPPDDRTRRHARGIHDEDEVPGIELPEGITLPCMKLDLGVMELGGGGGSHPSWRHLAQKLLDHHGPFRLAWLEALLRIADWRASAKEAGNA